LVSATGNVLVRSRNKAHVGAVAGQIAVGKGGFGASVTETTVVNTTEAMIDGGASVSADVKPGTPFITDITGAGIRGVSVEAESPKDIRAIAVGGLPSGSASAAGSASVTVIDDTTHAHISAPGAGARANPGITSDGGVNVVATSGLSLIGAAG